MSLETRAGQDLFADLRYAVRALRRNPGFTLAATLVLGLGLGATTAVWSVVDTVLLSDLPYPEPDRIVRIYQQNSEANLWTLSAVDIQAIANQQKSFEAFGGARWTSAALSGTATPEQISIGKVEGGFFGAIGLTAVYGRVIDSTDDRPGAPPVAVVSHALAERALGGATQAVGKTVVLDGVAHTVVGVLPAGRKGLAGITADAWSALQLGQPPRRGPFGFRGYARLKPGVTLEAAKRDLAGISERIFPLWAASFPDKNARLTPYPLRTTIVGNAGNALGYFAAAVLLVLLIAIANVGTLMLVRVSSREQELGMRSALGASRLRLGRLVLTECLVLGFLAAVAGLGFALAGLKVVQVAGPSLPRLSELGFGWRAAAFLAVTGCGAGLLVSLSPLLQVVRRSSQTSLAPDAARAGVSRAASRTRAGFVVAEFALALPLLLGAGLLLKSFLRLQQVDPGFKPEGLGTVNIGLPTRATRAIPRGWSSGTG